MYIRNDNFLSFHSTIIPKTAKKPLSAYLNAIRTTNISSPIGTSSRDIQACYKTLYDNEKNGIYRCAALMGTGEEDVLMRILGYNQGNDKCLYRVLKKVDKNVRYVGDAPDDGYDHGIFELDIDIEKMGF